MTYEIAKETFDKFHSYDHKMSAKIVAWFWRLLDYDTTIEETRIMEKGTYGRQSPYRHYYTVFGLKRDIKHIGWPE